MKKKVLLIIVSLMMTTRPDDYNSMVPQNATLDAWVADWTPIIQIGIGTVTIKNTTQPYFFNKYKSKYLHSGLNTLNQVNAGPTQQFGAGLFASGESFLESDFLTDAGGKAVLTPVGSNNTVVTFYVDQPNPDNTARTIIIIAKNSISTDKSQEPLVMVNSISIDLETLMRYLGGYLFNRFPWTTQVPFMRSATKLLNITFNPAIAIKIIVLNLTFDAVTADITLDSIDLRYGSLNFNPGSVSSWKTAPQYKITPWLLNQGIGITVLPNIDLSQTK